MNTKDMSILKFGGSCLRTQQDMAKASEIITRYERPVVIASAMNGITQRLIDLCDDRESESRKNKLSSLLDFHREAVHGIKKPRLKRKALEELETYLARLLSITRYCDHGPNDENRALILSFGERLSALIMKWYLIDGGISSSVVSADEILFSGNEDYLNASVDEAKSVESIRKRVHSHYMMDEIPVITGFYCRSRDGKTALLGRNSSDYTAAIVAYALSTRELVFWKDVPGLMTGDPKLVRESRVIRILSYEEAEHYVLNGARVLHPKVLDLTARTGIPIRVKNFRDTEAEGTIISRAIPSVEPS